MTSETLYDFQINKLNGTPFDLSKLKGKRVLLVNVASECGLTPQYTELEYINKEYSFNLLWGRSDFKYFYRT